MIIAYYDTVDLLSRSRHDFVAVDADIRSKGRVLTVGTECCTVQSRQVTPAHRRAMDRVGTLADNRIPGDNDIPHYRKRPLEVLQERRDLQIRAASMAEVIIQNLAAAALEAPEVVLRETEVVVPNDCTGCRERVDIDQRCSLHSRR